MKIPSPKKSIILLLVLAALTSAYFCLDAVFNPGKELTIRSDAEWGVWKVRDLESIRSVNPKFTSWTYCGRAHVDYFGNCPNGTEGEQHPGDFSVVRRFSIVDYLFRMTVGNDFSRYISTTFDYKAKDNTPVKLSTRCYFLRDMGIRTDEYGYECTNVDSLPGIYLDLRRDGYTFATALARDACSIRVYQVPATHEALVPSENSELIYEASNEKWPARFTYDHTDDHVDAVELQLSYDRSYLIQHGPHSFILRLCSEAKN